MVGDRVPFHPAVHRGRHGIGVIFTLYGIRNCDTIKKARAWLDGRGVAYGFHDYRTDGIDQVPLAAWVDELGWEALLNRAGTTFRKLPEADRAALDVARAIALMRTQPATIRRPVLDTGIARIVGFKPDRYAAMLTARAPQPGGDSLFVSAASRG